MAGVIRRVGQRFIGLMCGTSLGYLLALAWGSVTRSWPAESLLIVIACLSLILQAPYWLVMCQSWGKVMRQGLVAGLLLVEVLWLLYFL